MTTSLQGSRLVSVALLHCRVHTVSHIVGLHFSILDRQMYITPLEANVYPTDKGLSVVLIERGEGVETSAIKTSYSPAAGTAYVTFDNVKVPVEHLLGVENKGIQVILSNFNHERWMMVCAVTRMSRLVTEECMKWSNQRLVFGKRLIEQPVIRQKYVLCSYYDLQETNQPGLRK